MVAEWCLRVRSRCSAGEKVVNGQEVSLRHAAGGDMLMQIAGRGLSAPLVCPRPVWALGLLRPLSGGASQDLRLARGVVHHPHRKAQLARYCPCQRQ